MTRTLTSRPTATGATAEINEKMSNSPRREVPWCNPPMKWEPRAPINEAAEHDGGYIGRKKKTIADASRSKLRSKLVQLRAHVSSSKRAIGAQDLPPC